MTATTETVLFAIRAGVRLYGTGRKAYADATKGQELVLPLPKAPVLPAQGAELFFTQTAAGEKATKEAGGARLQFLLGQPSLNADQQAELVEIYRVLRAIFDPIDVAPADQAWSPEEIGAALTLRQWSLEAPPDDASPLQKIAGTLVNVAVDYFIGTPGAVNEERPEGRALKVFLEAIDDRDFSTESLPTIAPGLLVALLDSVSAHPDLIAGGPRERDFVGKVTKSLSVSLLATMRDRTEAEQRQIVEASWPELIARAFFDGGARTILAHPTVYLGARPEGEILRTLISTFTDIALGDAGLDLGAVVSSSGLEQMVRAALTAVANNPSVLDLGDDGDGIKQVILETVAVLPTREQLLAADLVPDLVSLVLASTATNLPLIIANQGGDPRKNLVILTVGELLRALSDGRERTWDPPLTQTQILELVETVVAEVARNPDWLAEGIAGDSRVLRITLDGALASLRGLSVGRLSAEVVLKTLQAALSAVSTDLTLLDEIPDPAGPGTRVALTQVLDLVFEALLERPHSPRTKWRLAGADAQYAVIEPALDALARHSATEAHLAILGQVLESLAAGEIRPDRFADALESGLAA